MIMKKFIIPGLVILASFLVAAGIMATAPEVKPTTPDIIPTTVRVLTVQPAPTQLRVRAQGSVLPDTESDLVSEVRGRIVRMSPAMNPGGFFNAGDVSHTNQS